MAHCMLSYDEQRFDDFTRHCSATQMHATVSPLLHSSGASVVTVSQLQKLGPLHDRRPVKSVSDGGCLVRSHVDPSCVLCHAVMRAAQGRVVSPLVDLYNTVPLAPEANTSVIFSDAAAATFAGGGGGALGISIAGLVGTLPEDGCLLGGTVAIGAEFLDVPALLIYGVPDAISRGTLNITAATVADPTAPPEVDLNLLSAPGEAARVVQCLTRLAGVNDAVRQELGLFNILPGTPVVNETYLRVASDNSYHYSAGCAVGKVVDGEFRVPGVEGLRVVDASVIPQLPSGSGLMASVYALAEHAAELMIGEDARGSGTYIRRGVGWPCSFKARAYTKL